MDSIANMKALFIVVNVGFTEEVLALAREMGVRGATIMGARGESTYHESILGVTVDVEKDMVMCIVDNEIAEKVITVVGEKAGVDTPAHAVCFTLPVDKTVVIEKTPE